MCGIPHQIWHHTLEDATRHQGVAADLGILFDHQHRAALLCRLGSRGQSGTTGTNNNHIPCAFHGHLFRLGQAGGLELFLVRHLGHIGSLRDGCHQPPARHRGSCQGIHASAVGHDDPWNQLVEHDVADMGRLVLLQHLDIRDARVAERHTQADVAVMPLCSHLVGSCHERQPFRLFLAAANKEYCHNYNPDLASLHLSCTHKIFCILLVGVSHAITSSRVRCLYFQNNPALPKADVVA